MALSNAQKDALGAIAVELEVMETWFTGARARKVRVLTEKVRGLADGSADPQEIIAAAPVVTTEVDTST